MSEHTQTCRAPASTCETETCCSAESQTTTAFTPRADVVETDQDVRIYLDLPGASAEDIDLRTHQRELTIQAKASSRREGDYLRQEYEVGDYRRVFSLGDGVDESEISAEWENGVLAVVLPKPREAQPRKIAIKA